MKSYIAVKPGHHAFYCNKKLDTASSVIWWKKTVVTSFKADSCIFYNEALSSSMPSQIPFSLALTAGAAEYTNFISAEG